jgi:hypothetical protein
MVKKAVFFPHSGDEFKSPEELREWLATELKNRGGFYRLHNPQSLGSLEKGSIVFFRKKDYVVGMAIVEEDLRGLTEEEKNINSDYEKVIKFFPESIWAFTNSEFINIDKITGIISKGFGEGFTAVEKLEELLDILSLIKSKEAVP